MAIEIYRLGLKGSWIEKNLKEINNGEIKDD